MSITRRITENLKKELRLLIKQNNLDGDLFKKRSENLNVFFEKSESIKCFLTITAETIKETLSSEQKQHFLNSKRLKEIPCVSNILKLILDELLKDNDALVFHFDLDEETIKDNILSSLYKWYESVDNRNQTEEKDIRRLDSLARLFLFKPGLSVCTAIAFHQGQLIISLNVSKQNVIPRLIDAVYHRIKLLQAYIAQVKFLSMEEYNLKQDYLTETFYHDLMQYEGAKHVPKDILTQAIDKLTDAIFFDEKGFDSQIKAALTQPKIDFRLLLPSVKCNELPNLIIMSKQDIEHNIRIIDEAYSFVTEPETIPIDSINKLCSVADIHAEQLLAYFLFKVLNTQEYSEANPLKIGLTKLCCKTCELNLAELPIKKRGEHSLLYGNAQSLINPERQSKTFKTPVRGITEATRSPVDSAKKRRLSSITNFGAINVARKILFLTADSPNDSLEVESDEEETQDSQFFSRV